MPNHIQAIAHSGTNGYCVAKIENPIIAYAIQDLLEQDGFTAYVKEGQGGYYTVVYFVKEPLFMYKIPQKDMWPNRSLEETG